MSVSLTTTPPVRRPRRHHTTNKETNVSTINDATTNDATTDSATEPATDPRSSGRRALLRTMAAGAAGAAVAGATGLVGGQPVSAADPNDLALDVASNLHATRSGANYTGANVASSFTIESGPTAANNDTILNGAFANTGTAFIGIANSGGPQAIGVTGWSKVPLGTGVVGFTGGAGAYGGEFFGGLAEVRLRPGGAAPITLTNAHKAGELYEDETGTLWICVLDGTPGTWRELGGTASSGAFHAISPKRVYDSRSGAGKLQPGEDRTISVAVSAGVDAIPAGATAVSVTFTITQTEGSGGYVAVRPAGTPYEGTSSINWFGPDQNLATTVISALGGDRQLNLWGGRAATHVVVDVTGYYR